jgi:hypothetical protein
MNRFRVLLDLGKCLFLNGGDDHVDTPAARCFQHQEGKLSISGDESVLT